MLVVLALASSANIHLADSEADIALRVGQRNIKSFQEQTQLMIDAWQDACKIDKACTTADQTILAKVYSYYADTVRCRGNVARTPQRRRSLAAVTPRRRRQFRRRREKYHAGKALRGVVSIRSRTLRVPF